MKIGNAVKEFSEEQVRIYSEELVNIINNEIYREAEHVEKYVGNLRSLNEGIDRADLAEKIIKRRSWKACGVGAVTNVGGLITMPITMPTDLYATFRIQTRMILSIAYLYGWDIKDREITTDILLVMGGNGALEALSSAGVKVGQEFAKKAVEKYINREVMKKINKVISRKIITKAGEKSLTSFTKLVPLVGAPIGGAVNLYGTTAVGKTALMFYKG